MAQTDLSTLKNARLLDFLCHVATCQADRALSLRGASGFDVLELNVAIRTAEGHGLVARSASGGVILTSDGLAWARDQFGPAAAILALQSARAAA